MSLESRSTLSELYCTVSWKKGNYYQDICKEYNAIQIVPLTFVSHFVKAIVMQRSKRGMLLCGTVHIEARIIVWFIDNRQQINDAL